VGLMNSLLGNKSNYTQEYRRFQAAIKRNPGDQALKTHFIKFCLLNRFTSHKIKEDHITGALSLFDSLAKADSFDLQCHYLVGKYYQEVQNFPKACEVYLNALKRFNAYVAGNPGLRTDNVELAYSVALNLMTLRPREVDPEVERCFKIIRKSFPLHLKRIEYENEMGKESPDRERVKKLAEEIKKLKAEEDQETAVEAVGSKPAPAAPEAPSPAPVTLEPAKEVSRPKPGESKGLFSKLFNDLSPGSIGLAKLLEKGEAAAKVAQVDEEIEESFRLSPFSESPAHGTTFMTYHNGQWEGPFTIPQLRSMGFLQPASWVCRSGSEQVIQAYEVPDLQPIFH